MFTLIFDSTSGKAKYHQLYEYIKNEIVNGGFRGGEKLPSKRALASHLKISALTVENAYAQLAAEGYIYSVPKSGFFVENGLESPAPIKIHSEHNDYETENRSAEQYIFDFSTSGVDTSCFPFSVWAKLMRSVLSDENEKLLKSVGSKGAYELRAAVAGHLYSFRGIEVSPDNIIIGAGTEYLISLITLLLGHDKRYAVENPGYRRTYRLFERIADKTLAISQDSCGVSVEELRRSCADIVHTTPSHNFPLGGVMPISRRKELLGWAYERENRFIIEDEYDSEFRFTGSPIPSLFSLDTHGRVIYVNTFTKTLAPSMRISYMILPHDLMEKFDKELDFCSNTVPLFEQLTLSRFIEGGFFERHINRIKKIYRTRRDLLISSLENNMPPDSFEIDGENSGLHFLMRFNSLAEEKQLVCAAAENGICVHGLSEYYQNNAFYPGRPCIVIGYTQLSSDDIMRASEILSEAWRLFIST